MTLAARGVSPGTRALSGEANLKNPDGDWTQVLDLNANDFLARVAA